MEKLKLRTILNLGTLKIIQIYFYDKISDTNKWTIFFHNFSDSCILAKVLFNVNFLNKNMEEIIWLNPTMENIDIFGNV